MTDYLSVETHRGISLNEFRHKARRKLIFKPRYKEITFKPDKEILAKVFDMYYYTKRDIMGVSETYVWLISKGYGFKYINVKNSKDLYGVMHTFKDKMSVEDVLNHPAVISYMKYEYYNDNEDKRADYI